VSWADKSFLDDGWILDISFVDRKILVDGGQRDSVLVN
jgi:hypothetical protein